MGCIYLKKFDLCFIIKTKSNQTKNKKRKHKQNQMDLCHILK
jgi:hypothetical protein